MAFDIISKPTTNKVVSFFLPSKTVKGQALHGQSFCITEKDSSIKMTVECYYVNLQLAIHKIDKLASFKRICGRSTQMYKFSKIIKCKQFHAPPCSENFGF